MLTEGSAFNLKLNGISGGLHQLTGAKPGFGGGKRYRHDLIERALAESVRRLGARILRRWEAEGKTGANMRYIGLVLDGKFMSPDSLRGSILTGPDRTMVNFYLAAV